MANNSKTTDPAAAAPAAPAATAAPVVDAQTVETILHDMFVLGLAAAAFFIKNPNNAARAGQVVSILQGIELQPPPAQ